jgi:hypothetical protein
MSDHVLPPLPPLPQLPGTTPPQRLDRLLQGPNGAIEDIVQLKAALELARMLQENGAASCVGLLAATDRAFCIVGSGAAPGVAGLFDVHMHPGMRTIQKATPIAHVLTRKTTLSWAVVAQFARVWFEF